MGEVLKKTGGENANVNAWTAELDGATEPSRVVEQGEELRPETRQERKIIYAMATGDDYEAISMRDVAPSIEQRRLFDRMVYEGRIDEARQKEFLGNIANPISRGQDEWLGRAWGRLETVDNGGELTEKECEQAKRMIGYLTGGVEGWTGYADVDMEAARELGRECKTVLDFRERAEGLEADLQRGGASADKLAQYQAVERKLEGILYPHQARYKGIIDRMIDERGGVIASGAEIEGLGLEVVGAEPEAVETGMAETKLNWSEKLPEEKARRVLNEAWLGSKDNPDEAREGGREWLWEQGLGPQYEVELGETKVYLSDIYRSDRYNERNMVVAYVETDDRVMARTFYQSKSAGMWRFLPWIGSRGHFEKTDLGEDALNAPFKMQAALAELAGASEEKIQLTEGNSNELWKWTTGKYEDLYMETHERKVEGRDSLTASEYLEDEIPGCRYALMYPNPRECQIPEEYKPDWDKEVANWEMESPIYGEVEAHCYGARNGTLNYLFLTDDKGRSWVGGVECADAEVNSTGVPAEFVKPGAITTPMYEYGGEQSEVRQDGFWGNMHDKKGPYVSMERYIRLIPAVQEYRRMRQKTK